MTSPIRRALRVKGWTTRKDLRTTEEVHIRLDRLLHIVNQAALGVNPISDAVREERGGIVRRLRILDTISYRKGAEEWSHL